MTEENFIYEVVERWKVFDQEAESKDLVDDDYVAKYQSLVVELQTLLVDFDNNQIWKMYNDAAIPDDYDGCHSDEGSLTYAVLTKEMEDRLKKCGFLSQEISQ